MVSGVYIPFRHSQPLFNISIETAISKSSPVVEAVSAVKPTTTTTTTTTTTNAPVKSLTHVETSKPTACDVNAYMKCEHLLKQHANNNEALKFEVQAYAIQLANTTHETHRLLAKVDLIEKRNIQLFLEIGTCVDRAEAISTQLEYCRDDMREFEYSKPSYNHANNYNNN